MRTFLITAVLWSAASLAIAAPTTVPVADRIYVVDRDGKRPTPRMVVPDACAWPYATRLPDGTILAAIFNRPSHGRMVGGVDVWASSDVGATWSLRANAATPDADGPPNNRMNAAIGVARDGTVVLVSSGWTLRKLAPGEAPTIATVDGTEVDRIKPTHTYRSKDGGKTWTEKADGFPATGPAGGMLIPFGQVGVGKDGALVTTAYEQSVDGKKTRRAYPVRSEDGGDTWTLGPSFDDTKPLGETYVYHDGNGRWLAVSRHRRLDLYESTDDARTFHFFAQATEDNAIPGMITKLADGRLLLSNGNRAKGDERVDVRVSEDGGRTWPRQARLMDFIGFDGGYPSSVQADDGRVVTVYYAKKTDYHDGYHMGVVVWDPTKTFPVR